MLSLIDQATIHPDVRSLRPDYRALLIAVEGIDPRSSVDVEGLVAQAEESARAALSECDVTEIPHVSAWREAYKDFGQKPQRFRNSLESLLRRAPSGMPRINPLTDIYNAISVIHQVPLGGENLDAYVGPPRLIRATGEEPFDTVDNGEPLIDHPEPGEVVWADDAGVTCRCWNWRQCRRTRLEHDTTNALFILDALSPMDDSALLAAGDELSQWLQKLSPGVAIYARMLTDGDGA